MTTASLWSPKSHYRQTRKGKILQSTFELYLRDDLGLGFTIPSQTSAKRNNVSITVSGSSKKIRNVQELLSLLIPSYSETSSEMKTRLVVADTNVLLHNLDVLEHSSFAISNLIIPQTALFECRHQSFTAYNRVMELLRSSTSGGEGSAKKRCAIFFPDNHHVSTQPQSSENKKCINDENDARIRKVALYFGETLMGTGVELVLLTDDKRCRELAIKEQKESFREETEAALIYKPQSVRDHVHELNIDNPRWALTDLVAQISTVTDQKEKGKNFFPEHLPQNELAIGVKSGRLFQGFIRADRGAYDQCYVTVRQGEDRVAVSIIGLKDINRAVDGDIVAIELHPMSKWLGVDAHDEKKRRKKDITGIAPETAEPSIRDENNVLDAVEMPDDKKYPSILSMRKPTGKVVGILRRNFRTNYCGSIFTVDKLVHSEDGKQDQRELISKKHELEHSDGTTTSVFFPVDARIPPILVRTSQRERLVRKRILVAIDSWSADSPYPFGHYVKTLGDIGLKDVETEVLLHEHNIPCGPFTAKVSLLCVPSLAIPRLCKFSTLCHRLGPCLFATRRL